MNLETILKRKEQMLISELEKKERHIMRELRKIDAVLNYRRKRRGIKKQLVKRR